MKGFRTIIVNGLSVLVAIAELNEWTAIIPDQYLPWFTIGLALGNMALRMLTTTPIGRAQ